MRGALHIGRVAVVYLLLGLATTWAVAWGLALLPPGVPVGPFRSMIGVEFGVGAHYEQGIGSARKTYRFIGDETPFEPRPGMWQRELMPDHGPGTDWQSLGYISELGSSQDWGMQSSRNPRGGRGVEMLEDARGFPFLALWCTWISPEETDAQIDWGSSRLTSQHVQGGFALKDRHLRDWWSQYGALQALPYMPIWSGLALNTAFYALLFFVVVRIGRAVKHARRYRRGLCPRCKYDRVFDYRVPCPECGDAPRVRRGKRGSAVAA